MLLSQTIRRVAITGRTDVVGARLLERQGGRWTQQWIDSAFPDAAARTRGTPPPPHGRSAPPRNREATVRMLEELRRDGYLTDAEFERLHPPRAG